MNCKLVHQHHSARRLFPFNNDLINVNPALEIFSIPFNSMITGVKWLINHLVNDPAVKIKYHELHHDLIPAM